MVKHLSNPDMIDFIKKDLSSYVLLHRDPRFIHLLFQFLDVLIEFPLDPLYIVSHLRV